MNENFIVTFITANVQNVKIHRTDFIMMSAS